MNKSLVFLKTILSNLSSKLLEGGDEIKLRLDMQKYIVLEIKKSAPESRNFTSLLSQINNDFPNQRVIRVDCERTCSSVGTLFLKDDTKKVLEQMLTLYCKLEQISYKQGIIDILSPFVYLVKQIASYTQTPVDYEKAFLLYYKFSRIFTTNIYIDEDFLSLQGCLNVYRLLLKFADSEVEEQLFSYGVVPEIYASSWLLTIFSRCSKFDNVLLIWSKLIEVYSNDTTKIHAKTFPIFMCIVILIKNRDLILETPTSDLLPLMNDLLNNTRSFNLLTEASVKEVLALSEEVMMSVPLWFSQMTCSILSPSISKETLASTLAELESLQLCECGADLALYPGPSEFLFIDCRSSEEFKEFSVPNSYHISLENLDRLLEFPIDSATRIVIFGEAKLRSAVASFLLDKATPFVVVVTDSFDDILEAIDKYSNKGTKKELLASAKAEQSKNVETFTFAEPTPTTANEKGILSMSTANTATVSLRDDLSFVSSSLRMNSEWLNLNDWKDNERNNLSNARFFVAKRVLNTKMETKKCILAVSDSSIAQLVRHPKRVEYAKIAEIFEIRNLIKIYSKKGPEEVLIFHFKVDERERSITQKAFSVMRPSECIDLVKEKYKLLRQES